MASDYKGLSYLDIKEGLSRLGGNKALFTRLLDTFLKDKNWDKLCEAWLQDNLPDAANAAHAIKGICANLSMKSLYESSADLEISLKAGEKNESLLEVMRSSRDGTIKAIEDVKSGML